MVSGAQNRSGIYSADTQQLLKVKGLKCVCELCDCGRHHHHEGCTKPNPMENVFKRPDLKGVSTDYQSSYKGQPCHFVRSIRKPLPRLRNPNPPPMDFRTVTNTEFVGHENFAGRPKPFKLEDNYPSLVDEKFDGQTSYGADYHDRGQLAQVKLTRPTTTTQAPKYAFNGQTTHNATFNGKQAQRSLTYTELPSFAGSLLFPNKKTDLRTQNQMVYKGKYAPRSEFCGPREASVKIGTDGDYEHETVHRATYKNHEEDRRRSPKVHKATLVPAQRVKFDAKTQAQSDFPGYEKGGFPAPTKPCPAYPTTINLAVDSKQDFVTTNKERYKGQWDLNVVRVKAKNNSYSPPTEKFHNITRTMEDFTAKEIVPVVISKPAQNVACSKLKMNDETSYKTQFPKYKRTGPSVKYGDFHERAFYVKPLEKFDQQGGSVTTKDFQQPQGFRPRTNYKPNHEIVPSKEAISKETEYKSTFKQKDAEQCAYIKYLSEKGRHHHNVVESQKIATA